MYNYRLTYILSSTGHFAFHDIRVYIISYNCLEVLGFHSANKNWVMVVLK